MLKLALFFFIVSIIAGLFGFTGISAAAAGIAKVLFFIFIVAFVVSLSLGSRWARQSSRAAVSGVIGEGVETPVLHWHKRLVCSCSRGQTPNIRHSGLPRAGIAAW